MSVDDLELDRGEVPPSVPPPQPRGWTPWIVGAAVVLAIAGGALARWWTMNRSSEAPATPAAAAAAGTSDVPSPDNVALPPLGEMDPYLRTLLGALSARPELAAWLATDDLIHQMAFAIDRLSRGASPASEFGVLAPDDDLTVERRGRVRTIAPSSYRRYDGIAATLASADPAAVAKAYRTIQPRLNEAYGSLGRTESGVDVAVQQALDVLIATPIPDGPVEVIEGRGATWAFADPRLEALDPAQKQLLRMGPDNARRVIKALEEVRRQLQQ